jgi:hypothetical protein
MKTFGSARDEFSSGGIGTASLLVTLGVCLLYESYRYPFQISSSATGSYSDTPFSLQAGKYLLLAAIVVALLVSRRSFVLPRPDALLVVACAWIGTRSLVSVAASGERASLDIVAPFVFGGLVAAMLPLGIRVGRLAYAAAVATVAVHALANVVQIILWLTTGRLPALSWADGAIKRFGGLWDDPNSVAVFSALVVVYLVASRAYPLWLIALAGFNIVVSVSYSGIAALVVGVWVVLLSRSRVLALALVPVIVAGAVAVFVFPFERLPIGADWLETKQESALLRIDEDSLPTPDNWLLGSTSPTHSENSIAALVNAAGLVGLGLIVAWLIVCLRWTPAECRIWLVPVLAAFLFSSLLVPFIGVFPLGTLFPLMLSQAARERLVKPVERNREDHEVTVARELGGLSDAARARTSTP